MGDPALIEGRKHALKRLGRVLVLGLGKSGRAVVDYCLPLVGTRVESLFVAAGERTDDAWAFAREREASGVRFAFGCDAVEGSFDLCVASPGIPETSDFYRSAKAASAEVASEIEFAWRESPSSARWVAVTGTNGKTTTTALATALLRAAGMRAVSVGNIGDVALTAVESDAADVYVAETSSFQLASTRLFAPDVAVVLNVTPDHLAWHGGFEAYRDAKLKALANLSSVPGACAVLDATDDVVRETVRSLRPLSPEERGFAYVPVGTASGLSESMIDRCGSDNAAFVDGDVLRVDYAGTQHRLATVGELPIKGDHNVANALAASCVAIALGADDASVARALREFPPLPHRIEPCGSVSGVACVNDSKGTNVDATVKAFTAFAPGSVVALLGGCDKGTDLAPLVAAARKRARAVVCFGDAGARFAAAFLGAAADRLQPSGAAALDPSGLAVARAAHLADAFDAALSLAEPGDTVLLSPACSSFDEFSCYQERGDAFKALVAARAAEAGD